MGSFGDCQNEYTSTRLGKHSSKKHSTANDCDFHKCNRSIPTYYVRDIYSEKLNIRKLKERNSYQRPCIWNLKL